MSDWTATDVPDQHGRTIVITGANSGLGAEATRVLAKAGATVVMACRDPDRARTVAEPIDGDIDVRRLDLADLASVHAFADRLGTVDVLINNAGVMAVPQATTIDGFEQHIGINHLGPFALTGLLINQIRDRVVTVSSGLHLVGRIGDDLNWQRRPYRRWLAYTQSKLANLLFAYELHRRLTAAGRHTMSMAAHPGVAATEGQRQDTSILGKILAGGPAQPPDMGVLPILYAATAPNLDGGTCTGPDGFLQRSGYPTQVRTSRTSHDPAQATRLWQRSELLTGVTYAIEPFRCQRW